MTLKERIDAILLEHGVRSSYPEKLKADLLKLVIEHRKAHSAIVKDTPRRDLVFKRSDDSSSCGC